jgi:hypothetical protein
MFEQAASRPAEDPTRELYEQLAVEQGIYDRLEDKLARELIGEETFKRHRAESEERMDTLRRKIAKLTDNRVITQIPATSARSGPAYHWTASARSSPL